MKINSKFKQIEKYCEICGIKLLLKNNRDIIRKRFCSLDCRDKDSTCYLTPQGRINLSEKNKGTNLKKSLPGDKTPNWNGGK
jgi:hypothetical protein